MVKTEDPDFTPDEVDAILAFVNEHKEILLHKENSYKINAQKDQLWTQLAKEITSMGIAARTFPKVKSKWQNLVKGARKEWGKVHGSKKPTGGGKSDQLSARTLYIGETIGMELKTIQQIAGGFGVAKTAEKSDSEEDESSRSETPQEWELRSESPMVPPPQAPSKAVPKHPAIKRPSEEFVSSTPPRRIKKDTPTEDAPTPHELLCLQRDVLLQQKANQELEKEKLELEIWLLRKKQEKWNNSAAN